MFVAVTPINENTGIASGQPIWVNKAQIHKLELVSATETTVVHTLLHFAGGDILIIRGEPEDLLPTAVGATFRE